MKNPPVRSPAALWAVVVVGLMIGFALLLQRAPEGEPGGPAPTGVEIPRSAALELEDVAPVVTATPQLTWVFPDHDAPGWGEIEATAPADLTSRVARGDELYQRLCVGCHGAEGKGDGRLAYGLVRPPRDLTGALRTRTGSGPATAEDVFRTLTAGALAYSMPSYAHLPADDRWALTAWVLAKQPAAATAALPASVPPAPPAPDLHLGQDVFRARCVICHGPEGAGDGPAAAALAPNLPTNLASGPDAFRGGARPEDIARTVTLGRPGTGMAPVPLSPDQLWAVSAYVAKLAEVGANRRRQEWNAYFAARDPLAAEPDAFIDDPDRRWSRRRAKQFAVAPEGKPPGCLACHDGIEAIAQGDMALALTAFAGGDPSRECVVCHGGAPTATTKVDAHRGLVGNPGNLWVTSVGAGCAQCHSNLGALTTLMGKPLPEAAGGRMMSVLSKQTDPTGNTSGNYTFRVQRSMMAQETGKVTLVTSSADLIEPWNPKYSDFPLTDPDGPVPCVGSDAYKAFVHQSVEEGYIVPLAKTEGVPTFPQVLELTEGNKAKAALVDYGRKACFRCHLWGEGMPAPKEHRSGGCSACHVVWDNDGYSQSKDPVIPERTAGHPVAHRLTLSPPNSNCNHCHTRNPLTHGESHKNAGMECGDCHSSIDLHGDGNAYAAMEHQAEVRCEDCHGDGQTYPWDLPLGHGSPVIPTEQPRGLYTQDGQEHLLTSRGNPRTNWLREDGQVVVVSLSSGKRFKTPLLPKPTNDGSRDAHADIPGHQQISCSLCHNRLAPRCGKCHMTYTRFEPDQDWLLSARAVDPLTTRQQKVFTPGHVEFEISAQLQSGFIPFGDPDTRRDRGNRWAPREPGCEILMKFVDIDGELTEYVPRFNPGTSSYPPPLANTHPHENSLPARACNECHPEGTGEGKPTVLFGNVQPDRGDWWRKAPADDPSQAVRSRWYPNQR